jgi:hypothetical protein
MKHGLDAENQHLRRWKNFVAERRGKLASYEVAGAMKKTNVLKGQWIRPVSSVPSGRVFFARVLPATMWLANFRSPVGTNARRGDGECAAAGAGRFGFDGF